MKKIIIVEDEFRIRNGLSTLINKLDMGCKVIGEAENGFEGLKMISDMEPEVVITDIKMPKMDGLSMIRQAKEMGASCDFIILSGYAEFEYAQQGIQLGVMDYLLKPASVSDVKELLNKLNEEKEITQGLDRENCSDIVREMINVIEESYGMKLQLDAIAEKFHMTPEYLGNLFAKETGITFSNYLRQVRMEKAKELLTGTDMKIYEVACAVGYPDQKYLMDKGYISKECINWTQADAEKQFASGQAAMMINGPWQFSGLSDDAPDLEYGVAKVPKADDGDYASVLGGENVAICKGANVEASWKFLTWITSKEESAKICEAIGRYSPRADVDVQEMYKDDPLNATFAEILPTAESRGPSPVWPEISEAIYSAEQEVLSGQKDVDTAMSDAQAKIDALDK